MSKIKDHSINVAGRTVAEVRKAIRNYAKRIGMVAEDIKLNKRGSLRSGGKPVFKAVFDLRERKKKRR